MATSIYTPTPLLTAPQAAEYLGISIHTLRQWVSQHRVPLVKLSRAVRFDPAALAAWIAEHSQPARNGEADR